MNERDFCYWLKGFIELNNSSPNETQWKIIKDHLDLVYKKVTPNYYLPGEPNEMLPIYNPDRYKSIC